MSRTERTGGTTKLGNSNWVGFVARAESLKVPFDEVIYIEQVGKTLHIHRDVDIIHVPGRISNISAVMGEPLFQCHSYLIINLSKVLMMAKGEIIFDNLMSAHLGDGTYHKTRKKFNQYLLGEQQYNDKSVQKRTK